MKNSRVRAITRFGASAAAAVIVSGCISACATVPASTSPEAVREASPRGSELCILNDTGKTLPMVMELGPFDNGDHHPDPSGPLAPGGKWCTNGYNSTHDLLTVSDVTAVIYFTPDGTDQSQWAAHNAFVGPPFVRYGSFAYGNSFSTGGGQFEGDVSLQSSGQPRHDYHIRRLDDTEYFKEWLITVRS